MSDNPKTVEQFNALQLKEKLSYWFQYVNHEVIGGGYVAVGSRPLQYAMTDKRIYGLYFDSGQCIDVEDIQDITLLDRSSLVIQLPDRCLHLSVLEFDEKCNRVSSNFLEFPAVGVPADGEE